MGIFGEGFDPEKSKDEVARRLELSYPDRDPAELHELASTTVDRFKDAPVKGFIDTVAEHEARERLRAEQAEGA